MKKRTLSIAGVLLVLSGILFGTTYNSRSKDIAFTGSCTLEGVVTDKSTNDPVSFAQIAIEGSTFKTIADEKGAYIIQNLKAGNYTFIVSAIGYTDVKQSVQLQEKETKTWNVQLVYQPVTEEVVLETPVSRSETKKEKLMTISAGSQSSQYAMDYKLEDIDYYEPGFNTESYNTINENGFKKVIGNPLSTFSIDVDNASYSNIRRFISYGQTPPKDAVRIEEMLNYFDYDYNKPSGDDPFAINTEISDCPWNEKSKIIMIGMQGKQIDYATADPSNLVFLIDVSGSMSDANKLPLVKKSLEYLIDNLNEKDKIALVVYAGAAGVVLPSTSAIHKKTITEALNNLQAGGSTAGGEGINLAYKIAQENFIKEGNNRVILCTDGDFNIGSSSDAEMTRLIEEKRKSGVFLTICGFGLGNYKDSKMEAIANNGNGNYYYIDEEKEAKKVFITDMKGTLFTIAKDVKIQIEFNPAKVAEYRLIGYENRLLNKEDFNNDAKDAGELGAGHRVTAMYEVVLADNKNFEPIGTKEGEELKYQNTQVNPQAYYSEDIVNIKLRYKKPDSEVSKLIEKSIKDNQIPITGTSDNFRFACAVVEFGMLLRDSAYKGDATYEEVIKLANAAKGNDREGYRDEFIKMVQTYLGFAQK